MNRPDSIKGEATRALMAEVGRAAKAAARTLALASTEQKDAALNAMARHLRANQPAVLAANALDIAAAREAARPESFVDRLTLTPARLESIASGLETIATLPDPVGQTMARWDVPSGLDIARVRVPIGVIGVIFESRPNVTADAGALCMKAGNAAILRAGSDSFGSSREIARAMAAGLAEAGLPPAAIQLVPTVDRDAVGMMLEGLDGSIDVIVPRGGRSLVERVQREARVPVFAHLEGICHIYVDRAADPEMARNVAVNGKMRRTGVCGATETLLIDRAFGEDAARSVVASLLEAGCEVRGCPETLRLNTRVKPAATDDFGWEFLDAIIAVRIVDGLDAAMAHIARFGSNHTDAIITADPRAAETFLDTVDSAIVIHNASTQFADGGEFGFGAEIGIATGRLHARGPVGLEQLTTFKYQVRGSGQCRP
ncbi:MAG: glutamate-5-semialdehyde dehydrogenase [Hyphomicrobiales bacterium]